MVEAVIIAEENVAYLKVDTKYFDCGDGGSFGRKVVTLF